MMAKLTLNAEKEVIAKAKQLAEERGISVSAMFSQFIEMLAARHSRRRGLAPITRRLRGVARVLPDRSDRELFEEAVMARVRR